jgi:3-deoxy-D-manno-octulosonate 8-phosphate phosphatase (KDO 8-P phosphatase)
MEIAAILMDVDGVLTDGSVIIDGLQHEAKRISFADVMGISIGRRAGLLFGLVSGEDGPVLTAIAAKLGVVDVYGGCKDKAAAVRDFAAKHDLPLGQVCFIGDDVNDVAAFACSGLSAAPSSAHSSALGAADVKLQHPGGAGAVRELVDRLLICGPACESQ